MEEAFLEGLLQDGLFGLIGFVAGCIGTLVGAGGGFLVVPALMHLWPGRTPTELTGTSLLVVFFNGFSAMAVYFLGAQKKGSVIDLKMGGCLALAAIPGSLVGVYLFKGISGPFFTAFFGVFLVGMGVYGIIRSVRGQKASSSHVKNQQIPDQTSSSLQTVSAERDNNPRRGFIWAAATGFLVSALASGLGIGGGVFYVPLLVFGFKFPVHRATATSQFVMTVMGAGALIAHASSGLYEKLPLLQVFCLVMGAVLGAQVGARLAPRLKGSMIITGLAFLMVTIGIRLVLRAF